MAARERQYSDRRPRPGTGHRPARESAPAVVAAPPPPLPTGAIVTAARLGRLIGRSGWRIARQLPGAQILEARAQRLQHVAIAELKKLVEIPQAAMRGTAATAEELRAVMLVREMAPGDEPLRNAMRELLERSAQRDGHSSSEYLFGTIISQLVPDEARMMAALANGAQFACLDIAIKPGRGRLQTHFANASAVGHAANIDSIETVATYLGRLLGFGLVQLEDELDALGPQYERLTAEPRVQAAIAAATARKAGSVRVIRRTVRISALGRDFWACCDPSRRRPATLTSEPAPY